MEDLVMLIYGMIIGVLLSSCGALVLGSLMWERGYREGRADELDANAGAMIGEDPVTVELARKVERRRAERAAAVRNTMVTGAMLALMWTGTAKADGALCHPRATIVAGLSTGKYDEAQRGFGMTSDGQLLEFWRSDDGATWTILITRPNGVSCVVSAGTLWDDVGAPAQPAAAEEPGDAG